MKRKFVSGFLIVVLVLSTVPAFALPVDPDSPLIPIAMRVLDNGMRIIVKEISTYPIATVNVWVGAGAKDDPPGLSGLAHFFEHLTFKGTPSRPRGQIAYEVESVGGYLNAMTSLDFTTYFIVVPSDYAGLAMEIQADALRNSLFEPGEIDQERYVIHEEIRLRQDSPQTHLLDMVLAHLFPGTPYAKQPIGTFEELANVDRNAMVDFHAQYYVPNNMVLVVAGNVSAKEIFAQAEELYGDMEPKALPPSQYIPIPKLDSVITVDEEREVSQSYVFIGYPAPGLNTRDAAALTMASVILGQGRASRLYRAVVEEEQLVNDVTALYDGFADIGLFGIYGEVPSENVERFTAAALAEIARLQEELVTEEELARAKTVARSSLAFSNQSSDNVAVFLGIRELYGSVMEAVNQIAILEQVTAEDIQRAAQSYLSSQAYVLGHIRPEGR
ncbi:MAG: M16 family metallopeptidase [Limnochordia bacterium]|jgi:zinc protease|nr:MAG: hypothetical protein AA931_10885 [Peptococcaceae bacterium 1109]